MTPLLVVSVLGNLPEPYAHVTTHTAISNISPIFINKIQKDRILRKFHLSFIQKLTLNSINVNLYKKIGRLFKLS